MKDLNISIYDISSALSSVYGYADFVLKGHQKKVAYISYRIGRKMSLRPKEMQKLMASALIHDIGAMSLLEKSHVMSFKEQEVAKHCEFGYKLFCDCKPMREVADVIKYHHTKWQDFGDNNFPIESNIIFLADTIDLLITSNENILCQTSHIIKEIIKKEGTFFSPNIVSAFQSLSLNESFWLDISNEDDVYYKIKDLKYKALSLNELTEIALCIARRIDYRTNKILFHSSSTGDVAFEIAKLSGMDQDECVLIRLAGYLHDIGKIAIPLEVLDNEGNLSKHEFAIHKNHAYYTHKALSIIPDFEEISRWAAFHHESLNGEGYPFHVKAKNISKGARIMKISNIFVSLTEERPHRKAMEKKKFITLLEKMVEKDDVDPALAGIVSERFELLEKIRLISGQNELEKRENTGANKFKEAVKSNFNKSVDKYQLLESKYKYFEDLAEALIGKLNLTKAEKEKPLMILDVGCGTGIGTNVIKNIFPNCEIIGIDISEGMINTARRDCPNVKFICGDAENLTSYFKENTFDYILYTASIFLLPNYEKALIEADRVLKRDGKIAASVLIGLDEKENKKLEIKYNKAPVEHFTKPETYKNLGLELLECEKKINELTIEKAKYLYQIEALSAGIFPGKPYEERQKLLFDLLEEAEYKNYSLVQEWYLILCTKQRKGN